MIRAAILTISDSARAGTREDLSGPAVRDECVALGWQVTSTAIVPDEMKGIVAQLLEWIDIADVILTTGGTGISARDVTPEATRQVIERELIGVAEHMRLKGLEQTPLSPLSRGIAGTAGGTVIANLPGSPKGAAFSFRSIAHLLPHAVHLLHGRTEHPETEAGSGN